MPVVGRVAAGEPILAVENLEGVVWLDADTAEGEAFALRVVGDSMVDEHIVEGDTVIVRKQSSCDDGDLMVVLVEGEDATLKRVYREGRNIRLQPSNETMEPLTIGAEEVTIIGKVISLMRKL